MKGEGALSLLGREGTVCLAVNCGSGTGMATVAGKVILITDNHKRPFQGIREHDVVETASRRCKMCT